MFGCTDKRYVSPAVTVTFKELGENVQVSRMSKVFAGSDGSFISAWQAWKRRNHEYERFVMACGDTMIFRTTNEDGSEELVWYVGVDEDHLPDGVELNGLTVRDRRGE
jgi:hypothetical protein